MLKTLIAALSDDWIIGVDNQIPWHLATDNKNFKEVTMGHHLILGRVTAEGLTRPLPGRKIIVVTWQINYEADHLVAGSVEEAIWLADKVGDDEVFIGGGHDIYLDALPLVDRLMLTRVHTKIGEGVSFPYINFEEFDIASNRFVPKDDKNEYDSELQVYDRITRERW